jgi:Porin subfamily
MNVPATGRQIFAGAAMTIGFAVLTASGALAQTLSDPNRSASSSSPPPASASTTKTYVKSCPQYGAGFVQLPGSDTCVKIGGYVDGEIGSSRH